MAKSSDASDSLVKEGREAFTMCVDADEHNRTAALEDIRFARLGDQWPENIRKQREAEGRPALTINRLTAFQRQIVNDSRQNKPSIHVHPVDSGADKKTADIISGLIRNIEYTSNADTAYDTAVECAVSGGVGYIGVDVDYAYDDSFDMDIKIKRKANPFALWGDPNSKEADSSDWDVAFEVDAMTKDDFEAQFPKAEKVDWEDTRWSLKGMENWRNDENVIVAKWWTRTHEDAEVFQFEDTRSGQLVVLNQEALEDEDNLMLVQTGILVFKQSRMSKTCKVKRHLMSGLEVLKTEDWPGRYIPIVPVYGDEFNVEGKRYTRSLVHPAIDAQRMFNYWRTAATETAALSPKVPFIGPKGAFDSDINRWNTSNTKSHSFLEYDGQVPPQRQPLDMGPAAGALQEAMNASDDIKSILGMFDASLGARSNETSGRAILARQREGDVATFHFIDNVARAIRHTGRIVLDLIPHHYSGPRILRVIGEDGTETAQPVNQEAPELDKRGQPVQDEMGQAVTAMHDLSAGKYDLTVKTGPSFTTRREEAAMQMTEVMRAMPESASIVAPILAKNLDWPGADEIAEKFEEMSSGKLPPEVQKGIEEGKAQIQKLTEENQSLQMDMSIEGKKAESAAMLQQQKQQADAGLQSQKLQADMERVRAEIQLAREKATAEIELQREKAVAELNLQRQKLAQDALFAREKAATDREIAGAKIDIAARSAEQSATIKAAAYKPRPNA